MENTRKREGELFICVEYTRGNNSLSMPYIKCDTGLDINVLTTVSLTLTSKDNSVGLKWDMAHL